MAKPTFYKHTKMQFPLGMLYVFVLMVFVVGLRDGGGVDYYSYIHMYETLGADWYTNNKLEIGYFYLNYISRELDLGAKFVIFSSFAVSIYLVLTTIKKYSSYPALSIAVLFGSELFFCSIIFYAKA